MAPACLTDRLFTVGALDNFDHNPNSTTAAKSFYGTGKPVIILASRTLMAREQRYAQIEKEALRVTWA